MTETTPADNPVVVTADGDQTDPQEDDTDPVTHYLHSYAKEEEKGRRKRRIGGERRRRSIPRPNPDPRARPGPAPVR